MPTGGFYGDPPVDLVPRKDIEINQNTIDTFLINSGFQPGEIGGLGSATMFPALATLATLDSMVYTPQEHALLQQHESFLGKKPNLFVPDLDWYTVYPGRTRIAGLDLYFNPNELVVAPIQIQIPTPTTETYEEYAKRPLGDDVEKDAIAGIEVTFHLVTDDYLDMIQNHDAPHFNTRDWYHRVIDNFMRIVGQFYSPLDGSVDLVELATRYRRTK